MGALTGSCQYQVRNRCPTDACQRVEVLWPHDEAMDRELFWASLEEHLWTPARVRTKVRVVAGMRRDVIDTFS